MLLEKYTRQLKFIQKEFGLVHEPGYTPLMVNFDRECLKLARKMEVYLKSKIYDETEKPS